MFNNTSCFVFLGGRTQLLLLLVYSIFLPDSVGDLLSKYRATSGATCPCQMANRLKSGTRLHNINTRSRTGRGQLRCSLLHSQTRILRLANFTPREGLPYPSATMQATLSRSLAAVKPSGRVSCVKRRLPRCRLLLAALPPPAFRCCQLAGGGRPAATVTLPCLHGHRHAASPILWPEPPSGPPCWPVFPTEPSFWVPGRPPCPCRRSMLLPALPAPPRLRRPPAR